MPTYKTPSGLIALVLGQTILIGVMLFFIVTGYTASTPNYSKELEQTVGRIDLAAQSVGIAAPGAPFDPMLRITTLQGVIIIDEGLYHLRTLRAPVELRDSHQNLLKQLHGCIVSMEGLKTSKQVSVEALMEIAKQCKKQTVGDIGF